MTEFVLVDTNVLLDVTQADVQWMEWSSNQMARYPGSLIVNPLTYAELCYQASSIADVEDTLKLLSVGYREPSKEVLFLTAQAYKIYRQRGGLKTAPLADFFIGAHAQAESYALLTRDEARYRTYFPNVRLICP